VSRPAPTAGIAGHQLIFVTGKGGVGKSTVSAVLAIASAKSGRRTLLAEVASQDGVQRALGQRRRPLNEVELAPGLFTISIDPELAMAEYLRIRIGALGRALGSTKVFQTFTSATPGLREMQTMAKIWELAHPDRPAGAGLAYDVVVVDAPPTGHAIGLLRGPGMFAELARVGPVANGARLIATMVADPAFTGFVAVTTAEEMAVDETFSLRDALKADGLNLSMVVINRLYPDRFTEDEVAELEGCVVAAPAAVQCVVRAALLEHRRARLQSAQVMRIAEHMVVPTVALPFLFVDDFEQGALHTLADALAEAWPPHVAQANP
jgi:anion-transporting  ArsA/GET3 family ATPase